MESTPLDQQRADGSHVYANVTRRVALLRARDSKFADSVASFIDGLDLQIAQIFSPAPGELREMAATVIKASGTCRAAVVALESAVIQEGFAALDPRPTAELSGADVALLAYAYANFEKGRLVLVKQRDDPLQLVDAEAYICQLADDGAASRSFRKALRSAGLTIEAWRLSLRHQHQFAFPEEWWAQGLDGNSAGVDDVPSFTEFLVDSVFNRQQTQTKLKDETRDQIRAREPLDLKYHYVGWKAAKAWSDLTTDKSYAHKPHIHQIVEAAPDFLEQVDTTVPFNYVSLGPGGGDTDVELLEAVAGSMEIASLFLVDVSIELLQIAANQVISRVLDRQLLRPPPRVRAMLADFEDNLSKLAPILMARDICSFFTLLGFTIGNGSEMQVLRSLSKGTRPGDYVLFDARLHGHGKVERDFSLSKAEMDELVAPYDTDTLRAFAFSPVEEASDYAVRLSDSSVHVDLNPHWGHEFTSAVPDAINVYVDCWGIYENQDFREKMGIAPPRRRNDEPEVLRLATLTFYNFASLALWIEESGGFKVIWKRELNGSGLFLLERV